jgi:hypothetical protein
MEKGEIVDTIKEEAIEIVPREGMVGIMQFKELPRTYSYLKGNKTIPDFALIPHTVEEGLPSKILWYKVLKIAGDIVSNIPNLQVIEEPNITPPRISIHSEIIDPLAEVAPQATYLDTVYQSFNGSNLMPMMTD